MLLYLKKIYKNQKRQYHFLFIILLILSAFEFSFLAMYDSFTYFQFSPYERMSINTIPVLPAFIALALSVFVTKYFITSKKQEFSILLLSGRKPKDLFQYLLIQFGILTSLSFLIGIPIGAGIIAFLNRIIEYASYSFQLNYHFSRICFYNFWFLLFNLVIILSVGAHQFVILDNDIAKNIYNKYTKNPPAYKIKMSAITHKKKIPIFSITVSLIMIAILITSIKKLLTDYNNH